jgi:4-carboxymuconolactone decarboxylase
MAFLSDTQKDEGGSQMPYVPGVQRHELAAEQQPLFDQLAGTRELVDGVIQGPFGPLLHSPEAARRTADLGAYYRYESGLPSRTRHIVAMMVAAALDCQYEFTVHAELGRAEGLSSAVTRDLGAGIDPTDLPHGELCAVRFVRQLLTTHRVDRPTFEGLLETLGMRGVTDLVGNVGYLMMIACPLNAFEVDVRPGQARELPIEREAADIDAGGP